MKGQDIPRQYRWKVRERLAVVEYAAAHGLKPTAERFDLDRKTVRTWRARWRTRGLRGLVPRYPARRKRRVPAEVIELVFSMALHGKTPAEKLAAHLPAA